MSDYTIDDVVALIPEITDWYWNYGQQRKDSYALGRSTWLDSMLNVGKGALNVQESKTTYRKPTMAIWGPSQTGKSTLLADYIDGEDPDKYGNGTALQWSESDPVRFVGDICGGEVTVLNPFNKGADASGCVTRFSLAEKVEHPEYPVKVTLATESQIVHGLAVGYLSETIAKDSDDKVVQLSAELIKKWASEVEVKGPVSREAYEYMAGIADVVELLILSNLPRYENLEKEWKSSLRRELLDCPGLLSDIDGARTFVCKLLWDSWNSISKTYRQLVDALKEYDDKFGGDQIQMSYQFAAQILNISAVELAETADIVREIIDGAGYEVENGAVMIGENPSRKLFAKLEEFALFQGLVWELGVPLKSEVMRKNSEGAAALLEKADLLDFPGVANEHKAADDALLTDEALLSEGKKILTKVLKRGKTASIVVTSSRNLNIDGFSLLMRMNNYPSNPQQLISGIISWWKSYDKEWPPQGKDLPLNLVLTFTAQLVNLVADSGIGHGLGESFKKMHGLSHLSDPSFVNTFATNYPQFSDGNLQVEGEGLERVISQIMEDSAFQDQFGDNAESLKEMAASGGREYFMQALLAQATGSKRPELVREKAKRLLVDFQRLLAEASPDQQDASAKKCLDLDEVKSSILNRLSQGEDSDASNEIGMAVQSLVNIDPITLDDLPKRASKKKPAEVKGYLSRQFTNWRESQAKKSYGEGLGMDDDPTRVSRLLSYMIEAVDMSELQDWFRKNLGNVKSSNDAMESRRFLAAKMNNSVTCLDGKRISEEHRKLKEVASLIRELAENEFQNSGFEEAPYYISVIKPFLSKLESLKSTQAGERGVQAGDDELITLMKS